MDKEILIAEDSVVSRHLLRRLLDHWGYRVVEVEDGNAALKVLQGEDAPKLAILDWMMPGMSGTDVVRLMRSSKASTYTYVLLLTAKSNKSDILFGLEAGADDYLTKPFDAEELQARLRVGERIIDLQERLTGALSASEFRASHDALTGLYNRGMIINLLDREVARCQREAATLGTILVDVDHFKAINDTYGHGTGDQVLLEIAARMQSSLRSYDFLGRYGGEEFLIIAPDCSVLEIQHVAERLRQSVARERISVGDAAISVTISLGASIAGGSESVHSLLKRTDLALYAAKGEGRNKVSFIPCPQSAPPLLAELDHTSYPALARVVSGGEVNRLRS